MLIMKFIFDITEDEWRFSNATFTKENDFEI